MEKLQNSNKSSQSEAPENNKNHEKNIKDARENEKFVNKVLEIEKQADSIHDKALHDAEILPVKAEQEAQSIIEKSRQSAQNEAASMLDKAKVQEQSADILTEAEKNIQHIETLASGNFNRAVSYVVARVIGRE